ncbi:hypothetical protein BX666DRAFT_1873928 [Dichotomocladium elegans]|nr:hypothetical protein BX666DRAFT_1873928 [Dichotomocladium elegans]
MLRMYSVLQLQQVWQKPEEAHQLDGEALSPTLPVVQEEPETLEEDEPEQQQIADDPAAEESVAPAAADAAEDAIIAAKDGAPNETVFVEEPAAIEDPVAAEVPAAVEQLAAMKETSPPIDAAPVSNVAAKEAGAVGTPSENEMNKRDSKISTGSTSLVYVPQSMDDKVVPVATVSSALASKATSIRTVEEHPSPPTPKVSRSSQIQAKFNNQRRNFSRKLKRTFSMSSTTSSKRQTL